MSQRLVIGSIGFGVFALIGLFMVISSLHTLSKSPHGSARVLPIALSIIGGVIVILSALEIVIVVVVVPR